MKRMLMPFLLCLAWGLNADEKATTESGRRVILHDDGTWELAGQSVDLDTPPRRGGSFKLPAGAQNHETSKNGTVTIHYDASKWNFLKEKKLNDLAEFSFMHSSGGAYAMAIIERIEVPERKMMDIVLANLRKMDPAGAITLRERRIVNGRKVMFIRMEANVNGVQAVYYEYIYTGTEGSIQFVTYTAGTLLGEHEQDMEELLNGFVVNSKGENKI